LGLACRVERKLNTVADPADVSDKLPSDRLNVLLVTARPFEQDVGYRSISRPLIELVESKGLAAKVTVLRPPTLDALRTHLTEYPDTYHVLHFDGHGSYGTVQSGAGALAATVSAVDSGEARAAVSPGATGRPYTLQGHSAGVLYFETDDGMPAPVSAEQL